MDGDSRVRGEKKGNKMMAHLMKVPAPEWVPGPGADASAPAGSTDHGASSTEKETTGYASSDDVWSHDLGQGRQDSADGHPDSSAGVDWVWRASDRPAEASTEVWRTAASTREGEDAEDRGLRYAAAQSRQAPRVPQTATGWFDESGTFHEDPPSDGAERWDGRQPNPQGHARARRLAWEQSPAERPERGMPEGWSRPKEAPAVDVGHSIEPPPPPGVFLPSVPLEEGGATPRNNAFFVDALEKLRFEGAYPVPMTYHNQNMLGILWHSEQAHRQPPSFVSEQSLRTMRPPCAQQELEPHGQHSEHAQQQPPPPPAPQQQQQQQQEPQQPIDSLLSSVSVLSEQVGRLASRLKELTVPEGEQQGGAAALAQRRAMAADGGPHAMLEQIKQQAAALQRAAALQAPPPTAQRPGERWEQPDEGGDVHAVGPMMSF